MGIVLRALPRCRPGHRGRSLVGVMDEEEATQTADADQSEEKEQQSTEEAKPAETRSEWDTDLEPDSRSQ